MTIKWVWGFWGFEGYIAGVYNYSHILLYCACIVSYSITSHHPAGDACPVATGTCSHVFHEHCIARWLQQQQRTAEEGATQQTCPMCRQPWTFKRPPRTSHLHSWAGLHSPLAIAHCTRAFTIFLFHSPFSLLCLYTGTYEYIRILFEYLRVLTNTIHRSDWVNCRLHHMNDFCLFN